MFIFNIQFQLLAMLFDVLLVIHIACGFVSLILGMFILFAKKADKRHVFVGTIYFYALLTASLVALPMSYLHPNYFLFIIGFFTAYMILSGTRYLKKKSQEDVEWKDWALTIVMLIFGLAFICLGIILLWQSKMFGIVLLVFGSVSLLYVVQDYKNFKGHSKIKNYWLTTHIQRMVASYIASFTAFLVVNNTILPGIVAWLLPSLFFVPLIFFWSRKYEVKKKTVLQK